MNLLSNLWSSLVRPPAPPKPAETMIMSSPASKPQPAPRADIVRLTKMPSLSMKLTQGAALGPLLVGNNSAGLKPRPRAELTNSAPLDVARGPDTAQCVGTGLNAWVFAVANLWARWQKPA